MSKVTRLQPAQGTTPRGRAPLPRALERVREWAVARAGELLANMLDGADDTLFGLAEKETDAERDRYFDAMRELRIQRAGIEAGFRRALHQQFQNTAEREPLRTSQEVDVKSLALVQEDEMETQVALDNLARRARHGCEEPLRAFQHRLEYLFEGKRAFTEHSNPLDPRQLAAGFAGCLEHLPLDIRSRLIVLKLFERVVMAETAGLLSEANRMLADAGVLPDMTAVPLAPARAPGARRGSTAGTAVPVTTELPSHGNDRMFDLLRQLLATSPGVPAARAISAASPMPEGASALEGAMAVMHNGVPHRNGAPLAVDAPVQALSSTDLFGLLTRMQRLENALQNDSGDNGERSVKSGLSELLESDDTGAIHALEQADDDVINLVSRLFDFILDDDGLPPEIKALIGRLQIPLLKVAIADKTFFSNEDHQARALLNTLARAGCQWDPQQGIGDGLYQRINRAVHAIIDNYDEDAGLFQDLLEEFDGYFSAQGQRAERVAERVREAEAGKARGEQASAAVHDYLEIRLAGRTLPDAVVRLLREGWRQVLYLTWLREGEHSDTWRRHTKVVEALIWSVLPHSAPADLDKLRELGPRLQSAVRHGLEAIEYDSAEMLALCADLQRTHQALLNGVGTERIAVPAPQPEPPPPPALPNDHELVKRARALRVGQWVEMGEGEDARRAKLAANIRDGAKLVFINRRGIKVEEFDATGFALAMHQGTVKLIDNGALFDRALEAVIGDLRKLQQA